MPHLVTVTGARVPLHGGKAYVVGRGLDCDIVVEDTACSRRHARITVPHREDLAQIEDLESHNGTFVDGARIEARVALRDGARLALGGTVFLFRLLEESAAEDLSDTRTTGFELTPGGTQLEGGELSAQGALDLLRLLLGTGRDVTLHAALPEARVEVSIRGGDILAARADGLTGFNALFKLARAASGIFWVVEESPECERNIREPAARVLAELARCLGANVQPA